MSFVCFCSFSILKGEGEKMGETNAIIADTNVFVHDPEAVDVLREGGNTLIPPWVVIQELGNLKGRPDIGIDALDALHRIEQRRCAGDPTLIVERNLDFKGLGLDEHNPDHRIIATARYIYDENKKTGKFKEVKLLSRDVEVRILARELKLGLTVQDYYRDEVEELKHNLPRPLNLELINEYGGIRNNSFRCPPGYEDVVENEGVVVFHEKNGVRVESFFAMKKKNIFYIISPDINAMGLKPMSRIAGAKNWPQYMAFAQLLDPEIDLVFLQGAAGSGKTLLALAAAVAQRKNYRQIVITRPMVHTEDDDKTGYLKGGLEEKMAPWLKPIKRALTTIGEINESNKLLLEKMEKEGKISYECLDHIRGMTYPRTFYIFDEGQNVSPHIMKTFLTRAGDGTKVVVTGDLGQIDVRRRLSPRSNGMAYGIDVTRGEEIVGVSTLDETLRSRLAEMIERNWNKRKRERRPSPRQD